MTSTCSCKNTTLMRKIKQKLQFSLLRNLGKKCDECWKQPEQMEQDVSLRKLYQFEDSTPQEMSLLMTGVTSNVWRGYWSDVTCVT